MRNMKALRLILLCALFSCRGNRIATQGRAVRHEYHAPYVTYVTVCSGRPMMCHQNPIFHPERYVVVTHVGEQNVDIDTSPVTYDRVQDGHDVRVTYETGACGGYTVNGPASIYEATR